jgi:hypothetical protein
MSNVIRRLRRSAAALKDGVTILDWLNEPAQRAAMVKAAEAGLPSVAGISDGFLTKFGRKAADTMIIRQFIGRAAKHIMREEDYVPADTGVKLPDDSVFSSGTRYAKRDEGMQHDEEGSLLARFVEMLKPAELQQLRQLLEIGA